MISLVESLINEAETIKDRARKDSDRTVTKQMRELFSLDKDFAKVANKWYFNRDGDRLTLNLAETKFQGRYDVDSRVSLTDEIVNELVKIGIKYLASYKYMDEMRWVIKCKDLKGLTLTTDISNMMRDIYVDVIPHTCSNFNIIATGNTPTHTGKVYLEGEEGTKFQNVKIESFSMTFKADWFDGNSTIEIKTVGGGYLNWPDISIVKGGYDFLEEHNKTQIFNKSGRPVAKAFKKDLPDFFELFDIKYLEDKKKTYWMATSSRTSNTDNVCRISRKKPSKAKFIQKAANGWWIYSDDER